MNPDDIEVMDLAHGEGLWEELESYGDGGRRWTEGMTTICRHDETGEIWAVDWERGLTEYQENIYNGNPYRVEAYEVEIPPVPARTETRYRKVE